ncbi:MAG: LysM peptidoglycan-binding domain-containing protein [Candidatus Competibacter sp.]
MKEGDSLWKISKKTTGIKDNAQAIAEYNGINNIKQLEVGRQLTIPSSLTRVSVGQSFTDGDFLLSPARLLVHMTKKSGMYSAPVLEKVNANHGYYEDFHSLRGWYNGRIISFQGKTLGNFFADGMQIILCVDGGPPEMNGCRVLPEGRIYIEIPWFPNGAKAEFYDPDGKKIHTIDLRSVAECNEDIVCSVGETVENCPSDCD